MALGVFWLVPLGWDGSKRRFVVFLWVEWLGDDERWLSVVLDGFVGVAAGIVAVGTALVDVHDSNWWFQRVETAGIEKHVGMEDKITTHVAQAGGLHRTRSIWEGSSVYHPPRGLKRRTKRSGEAAKQGPRSETCQLNWRKRMKRWGATRPSRERAGRALEGNS